MKPSMPDQTIDQLFSCLLTHLRLHARCLLQRLDCGHAVGFIWGCKNDLNLGRWCHVEHAEGVSRYCVGANVVLRSYHDFDKGNFLRSICRGELGYVIRLGIDLRKPISGSIEAQSLDLAPSILSSGSLSPKPASPFHFSRRSSF